MSQAEDDVPEPLEAPEGDGSTPPESREGGGARSAKKKKRRRVTTPAADDEAAAPEAPAEPEEDEPPPSAPGLEALPIVGPALSALRARGPLEPASRTRAAVVAGALAVGFAFFARVVHRHYPIQHWLFWRYAAAWLAALTFAGACVSAGHRVVGWLGGHTGRGVREELFDAFCVGLLAFFLSTFAVGLAGGLYAPLFFALPVGLALAGGRGALGLLRRTARAVRLAARPTRAPTMAEQALRLAAWSAGAVGLLLVYVTILPPENALFDAQWYHLGLAEQYTIEHAIRRSPEAWYMAAYPHLASVLYTWCFLVPWGGLFQRVITAAHLELVVFLFTLLGTAVLARRLAPRAQPRFAWVVVLLFPGLYLYDSSLGMGGDHVAALWGPFIFVHVLRVLDERAADAWRCAALGIAGAALTKYSAVPVFLGPTLILLGVFAVDAVRLARGRGDAALLRRGLGAAGLALAASAPHWLKNLVWYGNPVYPLAGGLFRNRPWSAAAQWQLEVLGVTNVWAPQGTTAQKLRETLGATLTFSFEPHDWPQYHGAIPVFGSLFTLSLLALPFLRRTARVWLLVLATELGIFFWYWTHHEDRYLQAIVPWMAAATAATLALVWRLHWAPRAAAAALVGLQVVWGGDVPFYHAHKSLSEQPVIAAVKLLAAGHGPKRDERFDVFSHAAQLGRLTPPDAKVLVHEANLRLGIGRSAVLDGVAFQGGLQYAEMKSPDEVHAWMRDHGVTHVAWNPRRSKGTDSFSGDLLFFDFIRRHTERGAKLGAGFAVSPIVPSTRPPPANDDVLFLGCETRYQMGVYHRTDMIAPSRAREGRRRYPRARQRVDKDGVAAAVARVEYVVRDNKCFTDPVPGIDAFELAATHENVEFYLRH